MAKASDPSSLPASYEGSARCDIGTWIIFVVGLLFAWAGSTIDPQLNCDESGECAPWLVPVAKWMGIAFAISGFAQLLINPRRGSRFDPDTGDLIWWQGRTARSVGDQGRIHPAHIGRIAIIRQSDSADDVHLYDLAGERQPYFDSQVIPWPHEDWAKRLTKQWPHITLELEN